MRGTFKSQFLEAREISSASTQIARGTEITITPVCDGIIFNPEYASFNG